MQLGRVHRSRLSSIQTVCSIVRVDKPDLEFGDKVILPPNVLVEIQRLKIPLPLLFKLTSSHASSSECCQYCGVMEFSAPVGQMYAPYWMMQQLGVDEGANVHLESALSIPRGLYCQLQPNRLEILDIAASIGPKILLESAMRRYSCLGVGGTIMIEYGDERFFLKLVQVKPGPVVHLFGDVDLEVDFKVPDSTDPRRPDSALHRDTSTDTYGAHAPLTQAAAPPHAADTSASAVSSYGRRLADGGYVPSTVPQSWSPPIAPLKRVGAAVDTSMSLKHAQTKAKKQTEGLDPLKFKAMKAFSTVGYTLTASPAPAEQAVPCTTAPDAPKTESHDDAARPNPPTGPPVGHAAPNEAISCPCCLADLPPANADLHMLRCKQHTAYHRFVCGTCHERVLRTHAHDHVHCASCHFIGSSAAVAAHTAEIHAPVKCTCGASFPADAMAVHKGSTCPHAIVQCGLCFLSFQHQKFAAHYSVCSNRTQQCEVCNKRPEQRSNPLRPTSLRLWSHRPSMATTVPLPKRSRVRTAATLPSPTSLRWTATRNHDAPLPRTSTRPTTPRSFAGSCAERLTWTNRPRRRDPLAMEGLLRWLASESSSRRNLPKKQRRRRLHKTISTFCWDHRMQNRSGTAPSSRLYKAMPWGSARPKPRGTNKSSRFWGDPRRRPYRRDSKQIERPIKF
ncbi:hypothetical protein, variant 2 [Aphanomyces invadans]|uniref:TRAF-type domain-containing protein n=1 Tax=Aphanomyces invadans TaxID=157072 RepID=A0A024UJ59_9STRA|nr:hypothetical protein, variant 2 [Aphanomyces invadans]ETW05882.1 hypothetical protein, variant 2 [Aphanomyces invadans]|eukprot:XP_008865660.1 hypothetical protein, variant 2 [Aphanomyces invadans]